MLQKKTAERHRDPTVPESWRAQANNPTRDELAPVFVIRQLREFFRREEMCHDGYG